MCGVIGVMAHEPVNQILYDGLTMLQHRGQDAAGIVTLKDNRLYLRKDNGMVRDVFLNKHMVRLVGNCGIGHVRYPTAGTSSTAEAQPLYVNSPYGVALAHNGNLTNAEKLARELYEEDRRHLNTQSDSEVLLNIFAHEIQKFTKTSLEPQTFSMRSKKSINAARVLMLWWRSSQVMAWWRFAILMAFVR